MEAAEDPGIDIVENSILNQLNLENSSYLTPDLGIVKMELMDVDYGDKCNTNDGLFVYESEPSTSTSPIIQINNADSTTDDIKKEPEDIEIDSSNNVVTSSLNSSLLSPVLFGPFVDDTRNTENVTPNNETCDIVLPNILSVQSVSLETHKNVDSEIGTFGKFNPNGYEEKCFNSYVNLVNIGPSLIANDNFCESCKILFPEHNSISQHKMTQHSHFVMIDYKDTSEDDRASTSHLNSMAADFKPGKICPKCNRKFTLSYNMKRHWKLCKVTLNVTENITEMKEVIVETKPVPANLCKICNQIFETRFELIKHLYHHVSTNITQKYKCDFCPESFDEKSKLEKHLWKHVEKNLKKVDLDTTETIKEEINELEKTNNEIVKTNLSHITRFDGWSKKFLVCEKCDCQFIKSSYYIRHLLSDHTVDKKWIMRPLKWRKDGEDGFKFVHCNVCRSSFKFTAHYNKHRAGVHLKGTPCKGCGFKTASLSNCWKHRKTCHLYKAKMIELHRSMLKCDGCFKTVRSFKAMRLHTTVCTVPKFKIKLEPGKIKTEPGKIKTEAKKIKTETKKIKTETSKIKTEMNKVEYNCKKCTKTFEKYIQYYKHMIKHGIIAPLKMTIKKSDKTEPSQIEKLVPSRAIIPNTLFKCTPCGAHFQDSSSLKRHRICVHVKNMRVALTKCSVCKLTFTQSSIYVHRRLPHKNRAIKIIPDTDFLTDEQIKEMKFNIKVHTELFPKPETSSKLPMKLLNAQISTKQACNMVKQILALNKYTLFRCLICDAYFNGLYISLILHIRLHKLKDDWNRKKNFTCGVCSVKFTCRTALNYHKRSLPDKHSLNNFTVYNLDSTVFNLDKTPSGVIYKFCQKILGNNTTNTLKVPRMIQKKNILYRCEKCTVHFHECPSLKGHTPHCSRQNPVQYPCNVCNLLFSKKSIVRHRQMHKANPKLTLSFFKVKGIMEAHRENRKDRSKPTTSDRQKLTLNRPIKNIIYKCSQCDLHFNTSKTANSHLLKHTRDTFVGDKRLRQACALCNLIFDPLSIDYHILLHHKDNLKVNRSAFIIETLGTPPVKQEKNVHTSYNIIPFPLKIRVKKPVEPTVEVKQENTEVIVETITYQCELCPKRYATQSALNLHSKIDHVDEKPCPICRCLLLSSLIKEKHLKFFNDTFECCLCKNVFETSILKSHAKEHEKLYNCRKCTETFPSLELLDAHLDENHPEMLMVSGNDDVENSKLKKISSIDNSNVNPSKIMKYGDQKVNLRQCVFCEFSTYDQSLYAKHMMKEHKNDANDLDCSQCGSIFAKPTSLIRHLDLKRCNPTNL